MGNYINKYVLRDTESEKEKTQAQCTSIDGKTVDVNFHTPVAQKTLPIDPRSMTSSIYRTPIEVYSTPVRVNNKVLSAIPIHLQCKPYSETDLDQLLCLSPKKSAPVEDEELDSLNMEFTNTEMELTPTVDRLITKRAIMPIDEERYNVLGIDPRSPAADFNRTPMLIPKSMILLTARNRENLIRRGSYDTDVLCSRFSYCETSSQFNIPEIQALPDLVTIKARSWNLLNNEIDTRLNESDSSSNHLSETEADSEDKQVESGSRDESNTTSDSYSDVEKDTKHKEVHVIGSDTIKIWRDSLILDDPTELNSTELQCDVHVEEKISQFPKHEVITFYDNSVAKDTLSLKLSRCEINKKRADINKKEKTVSKSEAKITADEKQIFNCNDKNGTKPTKIRTPFGNRSNNGHIQNVLATNSPQQVIRNKNIKLRVSQENSSPHKYVAKHKTRSIE